MIEWPDKAPDNLHADLKAIFVEKVLPDCYHLTKDDLFIAVEKLGHTTGGQFMAKRRFTKQDQDTIRHFNSTPPWKWDHLPVDFEGHYFECIPYSYEKGATHVHTPEDVVRLWGYFKTVLMLATTSSSSSYD